MASSIHTEDDSARRRYWVEPGRPGQERHADRFARLAQAVRHRREHGHLGRRPRLLGLGNDGDATRALLLLHLYFRAPAMIHFLRHNGVDVGKLDFLGELNIRDL